MESSKKQWGSSERQLQAVKAVKQYKAVTWVKMLLKAVKSSRKAVETVDEKLKGSIEQ